MSRSSRDRVVDFRSRRSCADCSLRSVCLPAGLARGELQQLDQFVQARVPLDRGDVIFRAGDPLDYIYVVRTGSVRTVFPGSEGDDQVIGFHLPSELVGLDAISANAHQCDAVALERTSVCALPLGRLERLAAEIPALQRQFHVMISRQISHDHRHLVAVGRRTARERLALFLHALSERLESGGYSGVDFHLSMSREDIANYLGLALETVSRLLTKLAEEGVIRVERRRVRIVDPDALARIAGRPLSQPNDRPPDHSSVH